MKKIIKELVMIDEELMHIELTTEDKITKAKTYLAHRHLKNVINTLNQRENVKYQEDKKVDMLPMIDETANLMLAINQSRRKINQIIDKFNMEDIDESN